jgi:hypothetical protein
MKQFFLPLTSGETAMHPCLSTIGAARKATAWEDILQSGAHSPFGA